jgi:hypothetical protein
VKKGWLEEFVGEENGLSPRIPDVAAQSSDRKTQRIRYFAVFSKGASAFSEFANVQNEPYHKLVRKEIPLN